MTLQHRLRRLERLLGLPGERCPHCPAPAVVRYRQADRTAEPTRWCGEEPPDRCPRCGRPCELLQIIELIIHSREEVASLRAADTIF